MLEGTWAVRYADGTMLSQHDRDHPQFIASEGHPRGGEVPFRAIEWPRTTELVLESELAKSTFDISPPGDGYHLALKCRTYHVRAWRPGVPTYFPDRPEPVIEPFQVLLDVRAYLVCTMRDDVEVDLARVATLEAATVHVTYWLPDGSVHDCPHYDCPDVSRWVQDAAKGTYSGLMPATHAVGCAVDAPLDNTHANG